MTNAIFIGATGQNVGKTTLCLGIISGLIKRYKSVGFTKPVGQFHVEVEGGKNVDKDAVLFKRRFDLQDEWDYMSPVIIPSGFTRHYIDGDVTLDEIENSIVKGFKAISQDHTYTVVEGTGHIGVGSIIGLNNAKVASLLGLDMVVIATGGLGSAVDELALNLAMCEKYGVRVRGVILNRVLESKRDMVMDYVPRALEKWNIPLLGVIPFNEFLSTPNMNDFEVLFETKMFSAEKHRWRHYNHMRLVAGSPEAFVEEYNPEELIITPSSRQDIVMKILELSKNGNPCKGIILTGRHKPTTEMVEKIQESEIPVLYAPINSYDAMKEITSLITKTRIEDAEKVDQAIQLVEPHIDFDRLCKA